MTLKSPIVSTVFSALLATLLTGCGDFTDSNEVRSSSAHAEATAEPMSEVEASEEENVADLFKVDAVVFAEPDPVLGFLGSRESIDLNGPWAFVADPIGVGRVGTVWGGFPLNRKQVTGMELIEYNFDGYQKIRVPGDFQSQVPELTFYQGGVWYYRTIDLEALAPDQRHHLSFDGVHFRARVFVNGEPVGEQEGGYVPFSFDVTDKLVVGENEIMVWVNNELDDDTVPTPRIDWWPYGGLTRDVALVSTPSQFIRNAKVSLSADRSRIDVSVLLSENHTGSEARFRVPELGIDVSISIREGQVDDLSIEANPELWSPDNPKLYDVEIEVGADTVRDRIGFRTIETRGRKILLNGEPVKFKGISTHEEPIGERGVAWSRAHADRLLEEAKSLNANFVRAAHYPYNRHMAEAADEHGIMLWEEVPVYWNINFSRDETLKVATDQMTRLIERDWNRASVVVWSVANETPKTSARLDFLRSLINTVRGKDNTRLVSAALLGGDEEMFSKIALHLASRGLTRDDTPAEAAEVFRTMLSGAGEAAPTADQDFIVLIDDPLSEYTDIVSYNQYFGWYYSSTIARRIGVDEGLIRSLMLDFMSDVRIEAATEAPIHISETGAGAKYGLRGGEALIWTEEYQNKVYEAQLGMIAASDQVQGVTPWILKDFRTMVRTLPGIQDNYNRKGVIDENGQRKLAYETLREFYASDW